jgi:competence protein ComEC
VWLGAAVWPALGTSLLALAAATRIRSDRRRLAVALAALALLGLGLAGGRAVMASSASVAAWAERGGALDVEAVAVSEARDTAHGAWQVVRVSSLGGQRVRERAVLALDALDDAVDLGARIRLRATARPLAHDGFDGYLRRLHAVATLDPLEPAEVVEEPGAVWAVTTSVRERTREAAHRALDPARATLLTGLVTGDVRGQDQAQREAFRAAGLTHLVVVSGRHVGLVLASVFGLAWLAGLGARGRRRAALVVLALFVLVTRWQPSVLRAGTMAALALAAGLAGRRADPRHALAMAALLLLLVDPMLAGHLGFVLSMGATAGVLVVAPWLAERLPGPRPVRMLVAAGAGAQAGAAPVLLGLDGGLPLASLPANLVAVPAAALAQAVGLVAALAAQCSLGAGAAVASLAWLPLSVVLWAAGTFSGGPSVTAGALWSPWAVAIVAVAGLVLARRRARRLVRVAVAPLVVVAVVAWLPGVPGPAAVEALTVTMLDVGQGDAVLVEVPGEPEPARMLVDGGSEPDDAWRHLRRLGVRHLDAVVLSHPHHDHSGGLPEVLRRAGVGALLVGPYPLDDRVAPSAHETYAVAHDRGVATHRLEAGQRFSLGGAEVDVLHPPAGAPYTDDLNEVSLVLRVGTAGGAVLLTGDAEVLAQSRLLGRPDRLAATILKVPHHGGNTNAPGFLEAVGAAVALVGVGAGNDYGHPDAATLAELAAAGARVHRTDLHGTITVKVRGGTVEVETERAAGQADGSNAIQTVDIAKRDLYGQTWSICERCLPCSSAGSACPSRSSSRCRSPCSQARRRRGTCEQRATSGGRCRRRPARRGRSRSRSSAATARPRRSRRSGPGTGRCCSWGSRWSSTAIPSSCPRTPRSCPRAAGRSPATCTGRTRSATICTATG